MTLVDPHSETPPSQDGSSGNGGMSLPLLFHQGEGVGSRGSNAPGQQSSPPQRGPGSWRLAPRLPVSPEDANRGQGFSQGAQASENMPWPPGAGLSSQSWQYTFGLGMDTNFFPQNSILSEHYTILSAFLVHGLATFPSPFFSFFKSSKPPSYMSIGQWNFFCKVHTISICLE